MSAGRDGRRWCRSTRRPRWLAVVSAGSKCPAARGGRMRRERPRRAAAGATGDRWGIPVRGGQREGCRAHRTLRAEDLARVHARHIALPHGQHRLPLAEGARAAAEVRVLVLFEHRRHPARRDDEAGVDEAVQQLGRRLDRLLRHQGAWRASRLSPRRVLLAGGWAADGPRRGAATCCSSEKPAVAGLSTSRIVSSANS